MKTPPPKTNRPTARQSTPLNAKDCLNTETAKTKALCKLREFTQNRTNLPIDHLVFAEEAMEQLIWFRDNGDVEVGALAQTRTDDPLYIEKLHFIKQECTATSTEFDEDAQHDLLVDMTEQGLGAENFMRIWVHTHPGASATPSSTDWETFDDVFGPMPWSVMAIMGKANNGQMYCLFRSEDEAIHIPVAIDTIEKDRSEWAAIYKRNILEPAPTSRTIIGGVGSWAKTGTWQNPGTNKDESWVYGHRPQINRIQQTGRISITGSALKADQALYKRFFDIGYQSIVPIPCNEWWDENYLTNTCEEIWRTANDLINPEPFAIAMETSLCDYLGAKTTLKHIGIFNPLVDQDHDTWALHSPLAGLAYLREKHPQKIDNYNKAFPKKTNYKPRGVFHWAKSSLGDMAHCILTKPANQVIADAHEKDNPLPMLYGIATSLRVGWALGDCFQPAGYDLWKEVEEDAALQMEMETELYQEYHADLT